MKQRRRVSGRLLVVLLPAIWCILSARGPSGKNPGPLEEMSVAVVTDLHYLSPELTDCGPYFQKLIRNADGKMTAYSRELTQAMAWQIEREKPNVLIVPGDLTWNGEAQSHRELAEIFGQIEDAGIPVLVIPGNHDPENPMAASFEGDSYRPADSVTAEQFAEIYGAFGYEEALARDAFSLSYAAKVSENLWALMLDANTAGSPGAVSAQTLDWVEQQLRKAADEGAWVIAVSHQNLLAHNSLFTDGYMLRDSQELLELYERYPVICSLSGHIHLQHIGESTGGLTEFATSSLAVSPHQYGVLHLEGTFARYQTEPVDVSGWASACGEGDKLSDFNRISRQFFLDTGIRQALSALGNSPESEELASFFAEVNAFYFAGRMDAAPWEGALFEAWQAEGSFFSLYLSSIADDGFQNHTESALTFGGMDT